MTHWVHWRYILYYLSFDNQKMFLVHQPWFLTWVTFFVSVYLYESNCIWQLQRLVPLHLWEWHSEKAQYLLRNCHGKSQKMNLDVMTNLLPLSLQTIDRSEAVHLNPYLQWRNFTEQEVGWPPVCTGAKGKLSSSFIFIFFNFILYSKTTKFLCAVQMVPSCGLTVIFVIFLFF